MTRVAYIWVFLNIAFAVWFYAHEENARHEAISEATKVGLALGAKSACQEHNHLRRQIWRTAAALHPETTRADVRANLGLQNCRREVRQIIRVYERRADKP